MLERNSQISQHGFAAEMSIPQDKHVNSSAQIIVTKFGLNQMYTRKNNHKKALDITGPTAHYIDYQDDK